VYEYGGESGGVYEYGGESGGAVEYGGERCESKITKEFAEGLVWRGFAVIFEYMDTNYVHAEHSH
jgi:hypothetical protein